ncbi:MAG TPA: ABC-F family ATP-binding cassette domain-containing protein [Acidimicrobiales bacterium]|nr:ABC-F family ATP-binding cassette domain-containing protein [Acidimicrobiales bacterium]
MLSARQVTVLRGNQTVLESVSLSVDRGARLGVVGPNGVGKTTLLRVLAGEQSPDHGRVERIPAGLLVALLAQETDAGPGEGLIEYLGRRTGVAAASAELDRQTTRLAADPDAVDDYSAALDTFLLLGGDDFESRAATIAAEVGLTGDRLEIPVTSYSGGQSARARLAAVMLTRADVLLLDEPTNDLDFDGLHLLERTVARFEGAVVMVSHDRAFLDRAATRVLEIEEHSHRASEYAGAWSEFVDRRALARSQAGAAYAEWKSERDRLRARIRGQRSWSEEGVRRAAKKPSDNDKAQRGFKVNRTEKQASKVRISERALERLGQVDKPWEGWDLRLDLSPADRSGDRVAVLDGAVVRRGPWQLGPVDLEIRWAERIVVTGPNGSGKSTLLGAAMGTVALDAGTCWVGPSVRFGELDQRRGRIEPGSSLLDAFVASTSSSVEEARSVLAKFGLGAGHVTRAVGRLSPGERTRAQLAELMVRGTNCLVLDEPTNHLDLPAIEQLEEALEGFTGTLLVVTHDRWLLETLRYDRLIHVEHGMVTDPGAQPATATEPAGGSGR